MAKLKIKQLRKYICDTCHGNGYVRVATHDKPQLDFRDDSHVHQCWYCDSEGEFLISEESHTKQKWLVKLI